MGGRPMITQFFELPGYDWDICIFYDTDSDDADLVLGMLKRIGCNGLTLRRAEHSLRKGIVNTGLTYSNAEARSTVTVIGHSSSAEQFWNTFDHEKDHIAEHLVDALGIDFKGEELRYIRGSIAEETFKVARRFICECFCPKKGRDQMVS